MEASAELVRTLDDQDGETMLRASQCPACGYVAFPARRGCPACCGYEGEELLLGPNGTLRLFTAVHHPVPGSLIPPPYGVGLAEFPPGVEVLGLLTTPDIAGLAPGQPITVVADSVSASARDEAVGTYRFRP